MVSCWNRDGHVRPGRHVQCQYGTQFVAAGSDSAARRLHRGIACNPCKRERVAILFRTMFVAGLGMLVMLPLLAMNNSVDGLLGHRRMFADDRAPRAMLDGLDGAGRQTILRLQILKSEIHADMCSRGPQRYCVGGSCLSLPRDCGRP